MNKKTKISVIEIDRVIDLIIEGCTYREIADEFEVKLGTLTDFIAKPEHSARVHEALLASGDIFSDKAEQVLKDAKFSPKSFDYELKKARELAQHYRWKAAKRAPKKYGDRQTIEQTTTVKGSISIDQWIKDQINDPGTPEV